MNIIIRILLFFIKYTLESNEIIFNTRLDHEIIQNYSKYIYMNTKNRISFCFFQKYIKMYFFDLVFKSKNKLNEKNFFS